MLQKFVYKTKKIRKLDYSRVKQGYILLERKYGLDIGVKHMQATITKEGLTKSNLIVVTDNNDLYSLDRLMISARRMDSIKEPSPFEETERIGLDAYRSP